MRKRKYLLGLILIVFMMFLLTGCNLRYAATEQEKQNAWMLHETSKLTATQAKQENASATLQTLTGQMVKQTQPVLFSTGLPKNTPVIDTPADVTKPENTAITDQAAVDAQQKPDVWTITDNLLELGIALAGIIGGVYGAKAVNALAMVREKAKAFGVVVKGNDLFIASNPDAGEKLKNIQGQIQGQPSTIEKMVDSVQSQT